MVVSFLTTQAKVCPMARLVLSFASASQRTCIVVKGICEHTANLTRTASSSFFIPSILPGSRMYDRAFRADDRFVRLVSSPSTESDIPFSSLKIECQYHSTEDCGREICTRRAHQYSSSMVPMLLLDQSALSRPIAVPFRQPYPLHRLQTCPTLSCSPGSPYMNSQQRRRWVLWIHTTYFDISRYEKRPCCCKLKGRKGT